MKYSLDKNSLNMSIFSKMVNFATANKSSLKGIIDYEIAKALNKKVIDIPVFYSTDQHFMASIDAIVWNNYLENAKEILQNTKRYLNNIEGISSFEVIEVKSKVKSINRGGIFDTVAYKIILK